MSESFQKKCEELKNFFVPLSADQRYQALMEMGRKLSFYPAELKTADRIVSGCQSTLYLSSEVREGKLYFQASADALISAGLAALLIAVYSGETPEVVLKCPPTFIAELGLASSLSMNRSNGLAHIYLRMKQQALRSFL